MGSALIHYRAAALSDRGRKRCGNEDAFAVAAEQGVYVVCDGMGGAAAGEVASRTAVEEMVRRMSERSVETPIERAAEQAVRAASDAIFARARRNPRYTGMGTTMVTLVVKENHGWILNVGDSRCYRLRAGALEQLTVDHSLVDEQVRAGRMSPAEAHISPLRNIITRALGTQGMNAPDIFPLEIEPGDLFLLCSDGLTRELADAALLPLLEGRQALETICAQLVAAANRSGGQDNITCLLVRAEA